MAARDVPRDLWPWRRRSASATSAASQNSRPVLRGGESTGQATESQLTEPPLITAVIVHSAIGMRLCREQGEPTRTRPVNAESTDGKMAGRPASKGSCDVDLVGCALSNRCDNARVARGVSRGRTTAWRGRGTDQHCGLVCLVWTEHPGERDGHDCAGHVLRRTWGHRSDHDSDHGGRTSGTGVDRRAPDPSPTDGVLYLLHGAGTDETQWEAIGVQQTLDDLTATNRSRPFVVVLPDLPSGGDPAVDGDASAQRRRPDGRAMFGRRPGASAPSRRRHLSRRSAGARGRRRSPE